MRSPTPRAAEAARLIVINGPPAVGKTTLARRYVEDHSMALSIDLDSVRRLLGRWREEPVRSAVAARGLSLVMARAHLTAGHDVVLPQYLGNTAFLAEAEDVAHAVGARFAEFVLMDDRDTVVQRFADRTESAERPEHVRAGELIAQAGGREALFAMYDRLLLVVSARPDARVIQCPAGSQDVVYRRLLTHLENPA